MQQTPHFFLARRKRMHFGCIESHLFLRRRAEKLLSLSSLISARFPTFSRGGGEKYQLYQVQGKRSKCWFFFPERFISGAKGPVSCDMFDSGKLRALSFYLSSSFGGESKRPQKAHFSDAKFSDPLFLSSLSRSLVNVELFC